jgi:hypothetical protein
MDKLIIVRNKLVNNKADKAGWLFVGIGIRKVKFSLVRCICQTI